MSVKPSLSVVLNFTSKLSLRAMYVRLHLLYACLTTEHFYYQSQNLNMLCAGCVYACMYMYMQFSIFSVECVILILCIQLGLLLHSDIMASKLL